MKNMINMLELAKKHKEEYYRTRPIMRFLHNIGIERGIESRASQYAVKRAKKELSEQWKDGTRVGDD